MSDAIIFRDLPATFPEKDRYKKPSVAGSLIFHGLLILMVLVIPLLLPQSIPQRQLLISLVSPIAPPPPPPPPPAELPAVTAPPKAVEIPVRPVTPGAVLLAPTAIPREIANIIEEPAPSPVGVIGGVPGGVPGGIIGGVFGGVLSSNSIAAAPPAIAPPPPPPPPPKAAAPVEPVRVGGNVKEPRPIKVVPPVYPPLASKARVSGTVVLEATLTAEGRVEQIKVLSGHPLLVDAAIQCLKQWEYEPTYLNGNAVPVVLTARIHFEQALPIS